MKFNFPFRLPDRHRRFLVFACGLLCALALLRSHFRLAVVIGESMRPTFDTGDLLIVEKDAYRDSDPRRGDIVMAQYRNEIIVKRIVGLPGEEIEVKLGVLRINRIPIAENHEAEPGLLEVGKGRLFDGKFAIIGDNRSLPRSTMHAVVSKEQIVGKVVFSFRLGRQRLAAAEGT